MTKKERVFGLRARKSKIISMYWSTMLDVIWCAMIDYMGPRGTEMIGPVVKCQFRGEFLPLNFRLKPGLGYIKAGVINFSELSYLDIYNIINRSFNKNPGQPVGNIHVLRSFLYDFPVFYSLKAGYYPHLLKYSREWSGQIQYVRWKNLWWRILRHGTWKPRIPETLKMPCDWRRNKEIGILWKEMSKQCL